MNETQRRAIVWDMIERIAFRPSSNKDRGTWLRVYAMTLHRLWRMGWTLEHLGSKDIFDIPFLGLKCDYTIDSAGQKYSVSLQDSSTNRGYWQNEMDPEYLSKASLHSASGPYPRLQRATLQRDVEAVLNGMFFHPRCHAHLENIGVPPVQLDQYSGGLSSHEVRIGGGIENPYIFLFHLRYQFCLVADPARQTERNRLIDLFEKAIQNRSTMVNARDLFNFQARDN